MPVELLFALFEPEKLVYRSDCKGHAVILLLVCDIKRCSTTFYFACQEWEVHIVRGHKDMSMMTPQMGFVLGSGSSVTAVRLNPTA